MNLIGLNIVLKIRNFIIKEVNMIIIKVGETWVGNSYTDMINNVLNKNYKAYMKSTVPLKDYGLYGVAWFVYMDGDERSGWRNFISDDGNTIVEIIADLSKCDNGLNYTYRLAFERIPTGRDGLYECKFVGYFTLIKISNDKLKRTFLKIDDVVTLK